MGHAWHLPLRAFVSQVNVVAASTREDVKHNYSCFIRRDEDKCLYGGFLFVTRGKGVARMAVIVLESRPSRHPALLDDRHFPVADLSSGMVAGAERAAKANL